MAGVTPCCGWLQQRMNEEVIMRIEQRNAWFLVFRAMKSGRIVGLPIQHCPHCGRELDHFEWLPVDLDQFE